MARHDYNLPQDYEKRVEEGTMSDWYREERARRRAAKQDTKIFNLIEKAWERYKRRAKANSQTVDLTEQR